MLNTTLGVGASPQIASALVGPLCALAHLVALPTLFVWERHTVRHLATPANRLAVDPAEQGEPSRRG